MDFDHFGSGDSTCDAETANNDCVGCAETPEYALGQVRLLRRDSIRSTGE
jgi:hypothetical protein